MSIQQLHTEALDLLQKLIATPSFSKEEDKTASIIENFLTQHAVAVERRGNNVWAKNKFFNPANPTLLLNSHHDTVRPNSGYTKDPFAPTMIDGKLYGLGSNDAGGPLVSLIAAFMHFYEQPEPKINIVLAATAEEEISGPNGIESIWSLLPEINLAIVGEPTLMDAAIAEKGLMVLDCISQGRAGHAARNEGENAIYNAIKDIEWFRNFQFPKTSSTLGDVKMTVTIIAAGQSHNQVPPECSFTVDVRVTDAYTLEEVLNTVKENVSAMVTPRSLRLRPSGISEDHPLAVAAKKIGKKLYGSPTTSDQALIPVASIKMGPGDSARSHSADEFIYVKEVQDGIHGYIQLLETLQGELKAENFKL